MSKAKKIVTAVVILICIITAVLVTGGLIYYSKGIDTDFIDEEFKIAVTDDDLVIFPDNSVVSLENEFSEDNTYKFVSDSGLLFSEYDYGYYGYNLYYINNSGYHKLCKDRGAYSASIDGKVIHFTEKQGETHNIYNYYTDTDEQVKVGEITASAYDVSAYSSNDGSISCYVDSSKTMYICFNDSIAQKINYDDCNISFLGASSEEKAVYYLKSSSNSSILMKYCVDENNEEKIDSRKITSWWLSNSYDEIVMLSNNEPIYFSDDMGVVETNAYLVDGDMDYCTKKRANGIIRVDAEDQSYYYYIGENISVNEICAADRDYGIDFAEDVAVYLKDGDLYATGIDSYTEYRDDEGFRKFVRFFYDFDGVQHRKNEEKCILSIGSDIVDFKVSNDNKYIYYLTDENELWKVDFDGEKKQIANDVVTFEVGVDKSMYYTIGTSKDEAGTLFEYKGNKSKQISETNGIENLCRIGNRVLYVDVSGTKGRYNFDGRIVGSKYYIENENGKFKAVFEVEE